MPNRISDAATLEGSAGMLMFQGPLAHRPDIGAFERWHLQGKFRVMEGLFRRYLGVNTRFLDMACGGGDGLVLASLCQPQSELWGLDIDRQSLDVARERVPDAKLFEGNMLEPDALPKDYFDVVHEFGATFFVHNWAALARVYLSLLRPGGVLLWELPQKWSTGHVAYLLSVAPKITEADTKFRRILRSFLPSKYTYLSDREVLQALNSTGFGYEIVERAPIWYFYCRGVVRNTLDLAWKLTGDGMFDWFEKVTGRVWPRSSGYYLVVRKKR